MSRKFLVAYATRTGTTAEIAETIARTLAARGEAVDVRLVQDVTDLGLYDGVLLGSAVRFGQWLPEAQKFVEAHRAGLGRRPTAIFTVHGLNLGDDETSLSQRQAYLTGVRKFVHARSEGFFAGKIDLSKLKFFERILAKALKATGASLLDLAAVRAWAEDAYGKFLATGVA